MRIVSATVFATLVACGGGKTVPPVKPTGGSGSAVAAITTTCLDVAPILRGKKLGKEAGGAKENVIKTSCEADHWSPELLKCVASTPIPEPCIAKLTAEQKKAYEGRIADWRDEWGEEVADDFGGIDPHDFDDPEPPEEDDDYDHDWDSQDEWVGCVESVTDKVARELPAPPKEKVAADGDFVVKLRKTAYTKACDDASISGEEWALEARKCMRDATSPPADCAKQLSADHTKEIAKRSGEIDAIAKKTFDLRKKTAAIGCPQVVSATYADAKWKGKLDTLSAADKKKAMDESRTAMTKVCTADKWDATQRACIVANGTDVCLGERHAWGFPAKGVVASTGLAECDAYVAMMVKYANCSTNQGVGKDAILDAVDQVSKTIRDMPKENKDAMIDACKQGMEAIKPMLDKC